MNALQRLVSEQRQTMVRQYYALSTAPNRVDDTFSTASILPVLIRHAYCDYLAGHRLCHRNAHELRRSKFVKPIINSFN